MWHIYWHTCPEDASLVIWTYCGIWGTYLLLTHIWQ